MWVAGCVGVCGCVWVCEWVCVAGGWGVQHPQGLVKVGHVPGVCEPPAGRGCMRHAASVACGVCGVSVARGAWRGAWRVSGVSGECGVAWRVACGACGV